MGSQGCLSGKKRGNPHFWVKKWIFGTSALRPKVLEGGVTFFGSKLRIKARIPLFDPKICTSRFCYTVTISRLGSSKSRECFFLNQPKHTYCVWYVHTFCSFSSCHIVYHLNNNNATDSLRASSKACNVCTLQMCQAVCVCCCWLFDGSWVTIKWNV